MLDFTDEQKMARQMLRQWADKELAPHVAKMEKGEILPYDIMRKLIRAFGMDEMVRAQFKKLEESAQQSAAGGEKSGKRERDSLGDPGLMAVAGPAAVAQFALVTIAFSALIACYVRSDFSLVNVFEKLQVKRRAQAAALFVQQLNSEQK